MATKETGSCSSHAALQDSDILHKLFTYLPTSLLLSSCSFVSKTWNREARNYIQVYRLCTASVPRHRDFMRTAGDSPVNSIKTVCQFKEQLDLLIFEMEQAGRVIPFNGIKISSSLECGNCKSEALPNDGQEQKKGASLMKLKHLEISPCSDTKTDCSVHKPILTFIMNHSRELQSLKIRGFDIVRNAITSTNTEWRPDFPKLKEFSIKSMYYAEISTVNKEAVASILEGAPNLKGIVARTTSALEMLPEEKLVLLDEFQYDLSLGRRSMEALSLLAAKGSGLKTLWINQPEVKEERRYNWRWQDREENAVDRNLRNQFDIALQKLLHTCKHSLVDITFYNPCSLCHLSFPVLLNVKRFCIEQSHINRMEELWNSMVSIDYNTFMPRLEEMKIIVCTNARSWIDYLPETDYDLEDTWPARRVNQEISISNSVQKLTLDLQVTKINMPLLKRMFPNVKVLQLIVRNTWVSHADPVHYAEIWEAWPRLEEVEITGDNNMLKRNYDAEFCGLSEAEVDLLRDKDEVFLKAVHLVPISPSMVTMPNLRRLTIDLGFVATESQKRSCGTVKPWGRSVPPLPFISYVTEQVAFSRLIDAAISVASTIKYVEMGEDHDYCKYCENAYADEPYYYSEGDYEDTLDYDKPGSP